MLLKKKKKKNVSYNIRLTPQVWQHLPQLLKKQIAELLAKTKKLEEENEKLKKKISELEGKKEPEEVKVLKEALKQKKVLEKKKEVRRIALVPFIVKKTKKGNELTPILIKAIPYGGGKFVGKKGTYKYFAGFEIEETESGLGKSINFLLKHDKKSKLVGRITPSPSADITIFTEPYMIQKMVSGIYEMPVKTDGTLIKSESAELPPNYKAYIEQLKQKIAELEQIKEQLEAENYEINKKYQELTVENNKLKNELMLANYRADVSQAGYIEQAQKVRDLMREHAVLLTSSMEAQINEMLERRMNWLLANKTGELRKMLESSLGKPIDDEVWDKIENRFYNLFEKTKSMIPKQTTIVQQPVVKHEKKEGGKK